MVFFHKNSAVLKMTAELSFAERCKQYSACGTVALRGVGCFQLWKVCCFMQVALMQACWWKKWLTFFNEMNVSLKNQKEKNTS